MSYAYLQENIQAVTDDIKSVCQATGRALEEITLIGVTKTYPTDVMNAAIDFGITDIAENRVQEVMNKYDAINRKVRWHLIGHLQTNKVKYIVSKIDLIHSVDSLRLAEEINRRAEDIGKIQEVLIQINIADETQKFGIPETDLPELLEALSKMSNIRVCGLMNIAPFVENPEDVRADFKKMKQLYDSLNAYGYSNVEARYLSMGMSGDYKVALEEGSNMLRIGTRIFGKREA
jgi:hypothetical protein